MALFSAAIGTDSVSLIAIIIMIIIIIIILLLLTPAATAVFYSETLMTASHLRSPGLGVVADLKNAMV